MAEKHACLRLILDVDYTLGGTPIEDLKARFHDLVAHGLDDSLITGDSGAEVVSYRVFVDEITRNTPMPDPPETPRRPTHRSSPCSTRRSPRLSR